MRMMETYEMDLLSGGGFWTGLACGVGFGLTAAAVIGTAGTAGIIAAATIGGVTNGACGFGLVVKHFEGYEF